MTSTEEIFCLWRTEDIWKDVCRESASLYYQIFCPGKWDKKNKLTGCNKETWKHMK